jgi:hypothetical protein
MNIKNQDKEDTEMPTLKLFLLPDSVNAAKWKIYKFFKENINQMRSGIFRVVSVETIPGMQGGGLWRKIVEGVHTIYWYTVRTFVNATMYPHLAQQFLKIPNKNEQKRKNYIYIYI